MVDRLDGLQPVPHARERSVGKETPSRGDFEQTLKELEGPEERHPHATHCRQTDSECESSLSTAPARRLQGEGADAEVEAFLLPWQLISQATLSQLTRFDIAASRAGGAQHDGAIATLEADSAKAQLHEQAQPLTTAHRRDLGAPIMQSRCAGSDRDAVRKSEEASASRLSMSGLANPWSERLLRWISDPEQRVTAWVRDYGLEEADMPALIHDLREHASGQSVQLARIVVNGQERWNAERAHTTEQR